LWFANVPLLGWLPKRAISPPEGGGIVHPIGIVVGDDIALPRRWISSGTALMGLPHVGHSFRVENSTANGVSLPAAA
jgi:hypothetical protein